MSPDSLFLDHVAVVVPGLARAAKTYERLGFRLTSKSSHKGALTPGGPLEPYGSGNRCALEVVDSRELVARYGIEPTALPMFAAASFAVSDVAAAARYLRGQGIAVEERKEGIRVRPDLAEGAIIEFVEGD